MRQWLPNPHYECPHRPAAIHGTNKLMEPLAFTTVDNHGVAAPPTQTITKPSLTTSHALILLGHNEGDNHGPSTRLIYL